MTIVQLRQWVNAEKHVGGAVLSDGRSDSMPPPIGGAHSLLEAPVVGASAHCTRNEVSLPDLCQCLLKVVNDQLASTSINARDAADSRRCGA